MGGGGGFFSFVAPVVGALVGAVIPPVGAGLAVTASTMSLGGAAIGAGVGGFAGGVVDGKDIESSLMQGVVAGGTSYVAGTFGGEAFGTPMSIPGPDGGIGATAITHTATQVAASGLVGSLAGGLVGGLLSPVMSPARYSLPDLPSFNAGDGLDFLDQDPAAAPDSDAVAAEAARKRALLLEEETGPADLVLTSTSLAANRPDVGRKTLLGA